MKRVYFLVLLVLGVCSGRSLGHEVETAAEANRVTPESANGTNDADTVQETHELKETPQEGEAEEEQEGEEEEHHAKVIVVFFVIIIVLSSVFELSQDFMRESWKGKQEVLDMVNALFAELTTLGFVGLVAMILVKSGTFEKMQSLLSGERGETEEAGEDEVESNRPDGEHASEATVGEGANGEGAEGGSENIADNPRRLGATDATRYAALAASKFVKAVDKPFDVDTLRQLAAALTADVRMQVEGRNAVLLASASLPFSLRQAMQRTLIEWSAQHRDEVGSMGAFSPRASLHPVPERRLEEEPSVFAEIFEEVHIMIFIIMVCKVLLAGVLLSIAMRSQREFQDFESVPKPDVVKASLRVQEYRLIRKEFFSPSVGSGHALVRPAHFSFAEYLYICMAELIVELIHIPATTWLVIMPFTLATMPLLALEGLPLMVVLSFLSVAITLLLLYLRKSVYRTYEMCLPEVPPKNYDLLDKSTPRFYRLNAIKESRSWVEWIRGTLSPNKHEQCFYLWRNGPAANVLCIRMLMFAQSVSLAVIIKLIFEEKNVVAMHWPLYIIMLLPFPVSFGLIWPELLYFNTVVTSIGFMKNEEAISKTVSIGARQQMEMYEDLIYELCTAACIYEVKHLDSEGYFEFLEYNEQRFEERFPDGLKKELSEAFQLFDKDHSNRISQEELIDLLMSVGYGEREARRISSNWFVGKAFRELDAVAKNEFNKRGVLRRFLPSIFGGADVLSKPAKEFSLQQFRVLWMKLHDIKRYGHPEENVAQWFRSLDRDKSGQVDVHEFMNQEPLKGITRYCNFDSKFKVKQLFFNIANPADEDAVVETLSFHQLGAWMTKLIKAKAENEEEEGGLGVGLDPLGTVTDLAGSVGGLAGSVGGLVWPSSSDPPAEQNQLSARTLERVALKQRQ